jgi:hypothetical protein
MLPYHTASWLFVHAQRVKARCSVAIQNRRIGSDTYHLQWLKPAAALAVLAVCAVAAPTVALAISTTRQKLPYKAAQLRFFIGITEYSLRDNEIFPMSMKDSSSKLDPYARHQLDAGLPPEGFDVAVRVTKDRANTASSELSQAGLQIYSSIGDVFAGRISDKATLNRVLSLPFVREVQVSRPLHNQAR